MRTITLAAIAAALLTLAACSSNGNEYNVAACKKALQQQFEEAIASGKEGNPPFACLGLDEATLRRLAGEIISENMDDIPVPVPSWSPEGW
ncbi:hypothetical protein AB0E27_00480 [Streptomyces sparsogenes]|uniref:hypothetical protein n=1 Tax=Streptomyces sparsogenes TaxID=67365 RepID=UPI0033C28DB9